MALDGSSATFLPYTLNGLQNIAVDSSTVSTLQVNSLTPNRVVVSDGSDFLVSSGATSTEVDYLSGTTSNIQTQLNSKASISYVDTNFLNKTTTSNQTVAGKVEFQDVITNALQSIFNSGLKITNPTLGSWVISVEYIDAYSQNLLFYNTVSGATIRFTGDYGYMKSLGWGPSKVMITNSSSELVSSGVDSIKITYLDNVSSDIQTQLNSKLNLSGSNANQNIVLGAYKVQSSATPTVNNDYTNKSYVDTAISGLGALYVLKAGDTMTGSLFNSAGNFHAYRGGDLNRGCILYANNSDGATYASHNGGLASWYGIGFTSTLDNTTRFIFNTRDGSSSQTGTLTANAVNIDGQTALRVCVFDASKNVVSSSVSSTTLTYLDIGSSLTGLLNTKANLAGSNTFTGTNTFSSAIPITLSGLTASRALALNASGNIVVSATTSTELGYLSGTTSSVQTQLNTLTATFANYLPLTGGTLTGLLKITPTSTGNRKLVLYDSGLNNDYQYYGLGINDNTLRFNVPVASTDRFSFFAGTGTTSAIEVFRVNGTGALESGVSGASPNTTANLKMSSSASHIDNNAGEVYLWTAYQGHLGVQRNTTRNATTACLALGTADTEESELISYKADGSGYMPLSYAGSVHTWVSGNSTDTTLTSYTFRGQTGFDGSNFVNLQCQASQYGRNQLIMTGRYEASNDAWSFTSPRNAIRFRTQSSLNSAYTNRWTIQNFADKLGFLSSSGGDTPRVVLADDGDVNIQLKLTVGGTSSSGILNIRNPNASYTHFGWTDNINYIRGVKTQVDCPITVSSGDTSKILFGPNATWSAYLVVGAGTNELTANKAQLISTNGNWHQDAGLGKDTYINYYQGAPGQGNSPGSIYSYGVDWTHFGNLGVGAVPTARLDVYTSDPGYSYNNSMRIRTPWAGIMLDSTQGSGGRKYVLTSTVSGAGIGAGGFGLFDETGGIYQLSTTSNGKINLGPYVAKTLVGVNGGDISSNMQDPANWADKLNGILITSAAGSPGSQTGGLFTGYGYYGAGYTTCLAPGLAWQNYVISANNIYCQTGGYLNVYCFNGGAGWITVSDMREKEDIQDLNTSKSLQRILALKPKHYKRKHYESGVPVDEEIRNMRHVGFLAQEVQEINPHCISHFCNDKVKSDEDDGDRMGVNYNDINIHLVGAVQEQQKTINLLSERNQLLEEHARKLESDFAEYTLQTDRRMTQLAELVRSILEDQQPKLKRNKTIVRE
jgi:Chaperone of endosialidase/Phage T4 tail fibre